MNSWNFVTVSKAVLSGAAKDDFKELRWIDTNTIQKKTRRKRKPRYVDIPKSTMQSNQIFGESKASSTTTSATCDFMPIQSPESAEYNTIPHCDSFHNATVGVLQHGSIETQSCGVL